ncbi:DNA polymerase III subunit beta [Christensenellaceae bacterium OttesenSCG-928-K19]|nr:DNA polymerase III subunit beta [Christensenellaceae bacterium OttesenSCG-928-K19]
MQFTCAKSDLIQAVGIVARAASKMQKTILECILFTCTKDTVMLKATDIAISIKTEMSAQVGEEGQAAIPSKVLHEMISRFPESDVTFESVGDNTVEISCMNTKVNLQQMNPDEFPAFPEIDQQMQIKIQQNTLRSMINQTIFAVAVLEEKPILTGLLFDIEKDRLTVVALDGYRMAVRKETVISDITQSCVIPSRTMREVSRIIEDTEENIKFSVSGNMALFEANNTQIYTRLLEGEFVNYKNLLPKECATNLRVETDMLKEGIERASILARETNNVIKFIVEEKTLEVTSNSEMGKMDEKIPVITEGNNLKIAFNAKYVLDVLKAVEETEVDMRFNTAVSPCVVRNEGSDKFEYLILPVQMRE